METEILPGGTLEGTLTFGTCAQDSIRRHSKHPASIDKPMEFDAADRQPYTEYHPDREDTSVAYFRSLFNLLVDSTSPDRQPTGAMAIEDIAASLAEAEWMPTWHGTYGLSSTEATAIKSKLVWKIVH